VELQKDLRQSIELLRFVCAFAIVWFHMHAPGERLAYSGLALFLILTSFLAVGSLDRGGERRFWHGRARRIALPWIVWSLFYAQVNMLRAEDPLSVLRLEHPLSLLIGPSIHLWFLPFALLASLVVARIPRDARDPAAIARLAAGMGLASVAALCVHSFVALPDPLSQWAFAVPPVCYGLLSAEAKKNRSEPALALFLLGVTAASLVAGASDGLLQLLIAAALFEAFWRIEADGRGLRAMGRAAFGIYMVHPFFILVYHKLFAGDGRTAAAVVLVFALSALSSSAMLRTPFVSALV
jgi:peptidoglycan/LPS O-acetylase OafA/YrhL